MIGFNEHVTWEATHFFVKMKLTSLITEFVSPVTFTDEMTNGPFKRMKHQHFFEQHAAYTIMKDEFEYESPLGALGELVDFLILKSYLKKLLERRNGLLKLTAERAALISEPPQG